MTGQDFTVRIIKLFDEEGDDRQVLEELTLSELGVVPFKGSFIVRHGRYFDVFATQVIYDDREINVLVREVSDEDMAALSALNENIRHRD